MKRMKILSVLAICLVFACTGQEQQETDRKKGNELTSFIEKQRNARQEQEDEKKMIVPEGLDFTGAASKVTPGVVHILSVIEPEETDQQRYQVPEPFREFFGEEFFRQQPERRRRGAGSGVIISDDGYIVTNNHVIAEADEIEVTLHDNRSFTAEVIGADPATDLALLKIEETGLTFVAFGNSNEVEVGEWVLAVGNPFNLSSTVTAGIISAKARNIRILREQSAVESFLQTDAAVNPGNSGGALVNLNGKLIGVNTAIATPTGTYAGYAFAVPVNIVKKVVDDLLNYGTVQRGYLGVFIRDLNSDLAEDIGLDISTGVYVDSIISGSAAEESNLKKEDVIVAIDGEIINNTAQLQEMIATKRPGDQVEIVVNRKGRTREVTVTLKNREGTTGIVKKVETGMMDDLGINVRNLTSNEAQTLQIDGAVLVTEIQEGIVSEQTKMQKGFIITEVDRQRVKSVEEFRKILHEKEGGVMVGGVYPDMPGVYYYAFGLPD
ncbi:MAG: Do family serine endopeptidase [Bacteroidales bacterium]